MRVLVTGSPRWANNVLVHDVLSRVWHPNAVLVHGASPYGPEMIAESCWVLWGGETEQHPTGSRYKHCVPECDHGPRPLDQHGRRYCPMRETHRDRYMITLCADVCLAFIAAKSVSSIRCAVLAHHAGIPVRIFHSGMRSPQPHQWEEKHDVVSRATSFV